MMAPFRLVLHFSFVSMRFFLADDVFIRYGENWKETKWSVIPLKYEYFKYVNDLLYIDQKIYEKQNNFQA